MELWNSDMVPERDTLGPFAKFVPPMVANGRVYVSSFSNALVIYGLLSDNPTDGVVPQITSVVNGASYLGGPVARGRSCRDFRIRSGPAESANTQLDAQGNVSIYLSGTQVFFDGVSAPLLYASANQLVAVVPFSVAGETEVLVLQDGEVSNAIKMPVVGAAPAIFSADGTGGDQGAILDEDGTPNQFHAPAARGSIVSMYVTGLGQTNPAGVDGQDPAASDTASPLLPTSVLINGQPAEVVRTGLAPGIVQGVMQVQVRIPEGAASGPNSIVLQAGELFGSQHHVMICVRIDGTLSKPAEPGVIT